LAHDCWSRGSVPSTRASNRRWSPLRNWTRCTEAKRMYEEGDVDSGVIACSQSIGIVREIKPVAEVIGEMVREAAAIRGQLAR